jgi:hypothetical protein
MRSAFGICSCALCSGLQFGHEVVGRRTGAPGARRIQETLRRHGLPSTTPGAPASSSRERRPSTQRARCTPRKSLDKRQPSERPQPRARPNDLICAPQMATVKQSHAAPNGGSARVLSDVLIAQRDVVRQRSPIGHRPVQRERSRGCCRVGMLVDVVNERWADAG